MLRTGHHKTERSFSAAVAIADTHSAHEEESELGVLDILGSVILLKRDATLFYEGDAADFLMAGDFIGVEALDRHGSTAEAVNDTTVIRYERRIMDALVSRSPRVGKFLLDRLCAELSEARSRMLLLGRMNARERLASFLLRIAARSRREDCDTIPLPMTRSDIGDHLGLTTETVCRTFAQLKSAGLIEAQSPHQLRVLKREALAALAQGV
jgi:CRP/FNR family transcriptional regulator